MTRAWPIEDPAPEEDLASDIAFGAWLEGLDPLVVLRDLEVGLRGAEKARLAYLRRRSIESRQRTPKDPHAHPPVGNQREGST